MITAKNYLDQTQTLLDAGLYSDGCSIPFKTFVHRWLDKSRLLCAAHDFGSLGLISGVRPGVENNLQTWITHLVQPNPVYWIWGTVVAVATLPWVIWRRNLGIEFMPILPFHAFWLLVSVIIYLINTQG